MTDRRNDNRTPLRERNKIDDWEKIENILEERIDDGPVPLELLVEIERPIFRNGDYGYYRVNTTISVGKYYVRLSTKAVVHLLNLMRKHRNTILDAVDRVRDLNAEDREKSNGHSKRRRSKTMPPDDERLPLLDDPDLAKSKTGRGLSFKPGQRKRSWSPRGSRG